MAERPGFQLCMCPDGRLTQRRVDELLREHPPEGGNTWEKCLFWGDEEPEDTFWEALTLQGLFDARRAVVVRRAHNLPAEVWKRLSRALSRPNPKVWPVLCLEMPWEKGRPKIPAHIAKLGCLKCAEDRGWVWRSPGLDRRSLAGYVRPAARRLGLVLDEHALGALCAVLPPDAAAVDAELEKLFLLFGNRPLAPEDAAGAAAGVQFNIFGLLQRLEEGRAAEAFAMLREGGTGADEALFPLLGLLQRRARIFRQLTAGEQPYLHPTERDRTMRTAAGLGTTGTVRLWDALFTAEWTVKSGRRTPDQALDVLIGDLTTLFGACGSARH